MTTGKFLTTIRQDHEATSSGTVHHLLLHETIDVPEILDGLELPLIVIVPSCCRYCPGAD